MLKTTHASVVIAVSTLLLLGCGSDSGAEPDNGGSTDKVTKGCTERDGAWFGRTADGVMITSQTQEACEERLG